MTARHGGTWFLRSAPQIRLLSATPRTGGGAGTSAWQGDRFAKRNDRMTVVTNLPDSQQTSGTVECVGKAVD